MKKLLGAIMMLFLLVLVAGCSSRPEKIDITFEDAYQLFVDSQTSDTSFEMLKNTLEGTWDSTSMMKFNTVNTDTGFTFSVKGRSIGNQEKMISSGNSIIAGEINMQDKKYAVNANINIFQDLSNTMMKHYLKIGNLDLHLGTGNIQQEYIKNMITPLLGKWIEIDIFEQMPMKAKTEIGGMNLANDTKKIITNVVTVSKKLSDMKLLENLGETTYEGYLAYEVKVKPEEVKAIFSGIITGTSFVRDFDLSDINNLDMQGLLIVKGAEEVELLINSINKDKNNTILITDEDITFTFVDEIGSKTVIKLIQKSGTSFELVFDAIAEDKINGDVVIHGQFDIKILATEKKMDTKIEGDINITTQKLVAVLGEKTAHIEILLDSESNKIEDIELAAPTGAMLLSQLLSDNFGLPYMKRQTPELTKIKE